MLISLIIDPDGRVVAQSARADALLGLGHGRPCHEVVGMAGVDGLPGCNPVCARRLFEGGDPDHGERGWLGGRPARMQCSRAGEQIVCTIELLPLAPEAVEPLTPRQRQLLLLAAEGHTDPAIATICGISLETVHSHLQKAREKLHARSRTEAVAWALVLGLLDPEPDHPR
ncbi:helix-turn-helix transcriptional regulator [Myxococcota bacterium]|nr:helix-turn-helix transcriptional regulator [Myxococcota bacterium]